MALRKASTIPDVLVTYAEAVDSSVPGVFIANIERVWGLEPWSDFASGTGNIICLVVIVVEEGELFAVC
jgi:hypothetical protein